jgi:hypothetical protein
VSSARFKSVAVFADPRILIKSALPWQDKKASCSREFHRLISIESHLCKKQKSHGTEQLLALRVRDALSNQGSAFQGKTKSRHPVEATVPAAKT